MQLLRSIRKTVFLLLNLLLLAGCAQFNSDVKDNVPERPRVSNPHAEVDELLDFGANLANMPPPSRADECKALLKRQKDSSDTQVKLHLMVGRLLSDACGDISKILEMLSAIPDESLSNEQLQNLVAIDTEALKNLLNLSKKLGSVERKQKKFQTVLDSKDAPESRKDENQLLREKLEAIRSMEKQLDESGEGK